ncbi:glutamate-cysteine ligase family protein [Streptomyces sp. NPDC018045]|uniref:carboxylate-amine ligase n=1 Tax=Streptomyces sp. NPDC018045 TaxID=3365037 RepID=UPI00378C2707
MALSANSPFADGRDTGYASWRTVVRGRFPALGPQPYVTSLHDYRQLTRALHASEAMLDADVPFRDVRPNPRHPTLEVRVMDVPADAEDTVALAGPVRALVARSVELVRDGDRGPRVCGELVRAACWRAARDGRPGDGVDDLTELTAGAPERPAVAVTHP